MATKTKAAPQSASTTAPKRTGRIVQVIGPVIDGLQKPVQIVQMGATVSDLVNHAALAAYGALNGRRE